MRIFLARHRLSPLRDIDGRPDVLQRIQDSKERGDRLNFRVVGVRADSDRRGFFSWVPNAERPVLKRWRSVERDGGL